MAEQQGELPGVLGQEGPEEDLSMHPPEMQAMMRFVTGGASDEEIAFVTGALGGNKGTASENEVPSPFGQTARDQFIKKGDKTKQRWRQSEHVVRSFDITLPEDQREYEKMLNQAGDPDSGMLIKEGPPVTFSDPHAPKGYRTIISVKLLKLELDIKVEKTPYTEIKAREEKGRQEAKREVDQS